MNQYQVNQAVKSERGHICYVSWLTKTTIKAQSLDDILSGYRVSIGNKSVTAASESDILGDIAKKGWKPLPNNNFYSSCEGYVWIEKVGNKWQFCEEHTETLEESILVQFGVAAIQAKIIIDALNISLNPKQ